MVIHCNQWKYHKRGGKYGEISLFNPRGSRLAWYQPELRLRIGEEWDDPIFGTWQEAGHSKSKI